MKNNNEANVSIDFLMSVAILLITVVFALSFLTNLLIPYDKPNLYYPTENSLNILLNHQTLPNKPVGLQKGYTNLLDGSEIDKYYTSHGNWWELSNNTIFTETFKFPHSTTYYSQIIPVNQIVDNEEYAKKSVEDSGDVISIVRYKNIINIEPTTFYGEELRGKENPTKPLFNFTWEELEDVNGDITLIITNFIKKESSETIHLDSFVIGYDINPELEVSPKEHIHPIIYINDEEIDYINMFKIEDEEQSVKIILEQDVLYSELPNWKNGFYFQFNVGGVEIQNGETKFALTESVKPYKIVVWSW